LYVLFIEQSLALSGLGRSVGLITPNKFLSAPYAIALRRFLLLQHTLRLLYDVSRVAVFENASIYPIVSVIQKGQLQPADTITVERAHPDHPSTISQQPLGLLAALPDNIWGFILSNGTEIVQRINDSTEKRYAKVEHMYYQNNRIQKPIWVL